MIVNNSSQIKATPVSYELSLFEILYGVAHYCPVLSCTAVPRTRSIKCAHLNAFYFLDKMRAFLRILLLK